MQLQWIDVDTEDYYSKESLEIITVLRKLFYGNMQTIK